MTWLLASLEIVTFSRLGVTVGVLALFAASAVTLALHRDPILSFLKDRWKTVAVAELVFLVAFIVFLLIRMANPDLWHPYRGGEKPMDMAYLNAVLKSSYMPPYDPWFGGGYINYYYWGQFLVATLIHATGIVSEVAINLTVPLFFALTVAFGYSIVYNLASSSRRVGIVPPVLAGICGGVFVAVLGNLDGAIQVGQGVWRAVVEASPVREFDFWRSSRMMGPDPPGHEITEFPFFTFLFADPHAHLLALPFTLLSVGIAAAVVLGMARRGALEVCLESCAILPDRRAWTCRRRSAASQHLGLSDLPSSGDGRGYAGRVPRAGWAVSLDAVPRRSQDHPSFLSRVRGLPALPPQL